MDLTDHGARVGTAGFVLARLLLEPPSQALAENFGDNEMRTTWPLRDEQSRAALDSLAPDPYEDLPRDHLTMFHRPPRRVALHESAWRADATDPATVRATLRDQYERAGVRPLPEDDHVAHQVTLLAHLATQIGRAAAAGEMTTARAHARTAVQFRGAHLDPMIDPILRGIDEHARTHLYRAVPGLLRGFLTALTTLCTAVLDPD